MIYWKFTLTNQVVTISSPKINISSSVVNKFSLLAIYYAYISSNISISFSNLIIFCTSQSLPSKVFKSPLYWGSSSLSIFHESHFCMFDLDHFLTSILMGHSIVFTTEPTQFDLILLIAVVRPVAFYNIRFDVV